MVSGGTPPVTFTGTGSGLPPFISSSSRAPSGGRRICSRAFAFSPAKWPGAKRRNGGGRFAREAKSTPGGGGSAAAGAGRRAKASNRMGAAAARPVRPGTGAPSGRPIQTPIGVPAVKADRPSVAVAAAGPGLERDATRHTEGGGALGVAQQRGEVHRLARSIDAALGIDESIEAARRRPPGDVAIGQIESRRRETEKRLRAAGGAPVGDIGGGGSALEQKIALIVVRRAQPGRRVVGDGRHDLAEQHYAGAEVVLREGRIGLPAKLRQRLARGSRVGLDLRL